MRLRFSPEVEAALRAGLPVVALESSVVAQGLPPPDGVEAALACEAAVRAEGAVPATVGLLAGELWVGLHRAGLERLADRSRPVAKAGARDLAPLLAAGADAGTTVSATVVAAALSGIRLFATGGLGGVHRGAFGAAPTLDVSSDLGAIAAHPVGVVCAGAKAILDLPATLELLESLGVPVIGLGVRELPAFYCNSSGLLLEHSVADPVQAARLLDARRRVLRQEGGVVFASPVPGGFELPAAKIETSIARAVEAARAAGVAGKALTPWLLARLGEEEGSTTRATNRAVLVSNAGAAGRIAVALSRLTGAR